VGIEIAKRRHKSTSKKAHYGSTNEWGSDFSADEVIVLKI